MDQQNLCYDLRTEPWIPVERLDGTADVVSLRDALAEAHQIRRIAGEIPGECFALLRLLLALVYCVHSAQMGELEKENEERWKEIRSQGRFEVSEIDDYLDSYSSEFDLFDDEHPFYQVAGLAYMGEKEFDPIGEFMLDIPKPEKFLFAMRGPKHLDSLPFDLAARYLVIAQAYDTAGIKSPVVGNTSAKSGKAYAPKGALGTGWCGALGGIYLEGRSLFETLLFNYVLHLNNVSLIVDDDYAPWEREAPSTDTNQREPTGPIDLLTWQSRRIRLIPSEDGSSVRGVIISYGDVLTPVNKDRFEMMTGWRESKEQQKKLGSSTIPLMPVALNTARAFWRGLPSLLALQNRNLGPGVVRWMDYLQNVQIPIDWRFNVRAVCEGVSYGTQSSVVDNAMRDSVDLHVALLRENSGAARKLLDVIECADKAVGALVRFVYNVEQAQGDKRTSTVSDAMRGDAREDAYDALDSLYRARIAEFPDDGTMVGDYCLAWRQETRSILRNIAKEYLDQRHITYFTEHEEMSVGRVFSWFEGALVKALSL